MCCKNDERLAKRVMAKSQDRTKEITMYKVVRRTGECLFGPDRYGGRPIAVTDVYFHVYKPGVNKSTSGPGFHLHLTREDCTVWGSGYKVLPVRVQLRHVNAIGHDEVHGVVAEYAVGCRHLVPQVVVSQLRVDKREWRRAGLPC